MNEMVKRVARAIEPDLGGKYSSGVDYPNCYSVLCFALAIVGLAVLVKGCYCRGYWMSAFLTAAGIICIIAGLAGFIGFQTI